MSHTKNYGGASSCGVRKRNRIGLIAVLFSMLALSLIFLTACSRETLATPTDLHVDEDTLRLTWSEVVNSTGGYSVEVDGVSRNTKQLEYPLSILNLDVGTHTVRVMALTIDKNYFLNSEWSAPYDFTISVTDVGLSYKLINNATEYEVRGSGALSGDIVVPDTYNNRPVTRIGADAFSHSSLLTGITLGKNIREIGMQAFYNCSKLAKVTLSEGLEVIGEASFLSCPVLPEISFPTTLKTIGDRAFIYCNSLKEIEIPDNVTYLGLRAFESCNVLEKVDIGEGITRLNRSTFFNCKELSDVKLGSNLTYITQDTFRDCPKLTSIDIPEKMETIEFNSFLGSGLFTEDAVLVYAGNWLVGYNKNILATAKEIEDNTATFYDINIETNTKGISNAALSGFTNLKSVVIPSSVKRMGEGAFFGCISLLEVTIPASVGIVPNRAFESCYSLKKVVVSEGITSIGVNAFLNCAALTDATLPAAISANKGISLPSTLTGIGQNAFVNTAIYENDGKTLDNIVYVGKWLVNYIPFVPDEDNPIDKRTLITLKDNTVGIADRALDWFISIREVVFKPTLKYIGDGAFANCTGLTAFPNFDNTEVTELRANTFRGCTGFNMAVIPEKITSLGDSVFESSGLYAISLHDGIKTIPKRAFARSTIFGVTMGNGITTIENEAFIECYALSSIAIPDSVTKIGANAFQMCLSLATVTLPQNLEIIEDSLFRDCVKLSSIVIPENVKTIGNHAFRGCEILANVAIPASVTEIGGHAFRDCSAFTAIVIPDTVTSVGNYAFSGCSNARTVNIGSGISALPVGVFEECMVLASVQIPDTIKSIGDYAFKGCSRLGSIIISKFVAGMGEHVFEGATVTIYSETTGSTDWESQWNSTNRPVFWGCTLSEDRAKDKLHVVSFVKYENAITNFGGHNIALPTRSGYVCQGWSDGTTHYSVLRADDIAIGLTLHTVWRAA